MLPDNRLGLESAAQGIRSRLSARAAKARGGRFAPVEWPRSRGPSPNPKRH